MIIHDNSHYNHDITKWYCQWLPFPEENHCTARSARSARSARGRSRCQELFGITQRNLQIQGITSIFGASKFAWKLHRSQHMGTIQIIQPDHWGSLGISTYFNHRYIVLTAMMMEYRDPSIGHKMAQVILKTSMISYDTSMIL